jgi:hypothetical protein
MSGTKGLVFTIALAIAWSFTPANVLAQAVWVTGNAPARTGENPESEEKNYWEIEGFNEVFIDEENALYSKRPYQGIVPRLRDELEILRAPETGLNTIMWVGYQHRQLFSRVFVQTTHMPVFTVLQKSPTHIVITFERTMFRDVNSQREIVTGNFNTKVSRIIPKAIGKDGAEIHIHLQDAASFLYRQEGNYLYLDVERTATN